MTPHQGAGAGQAIEDAYILGALLSHPMTTRSTLSIALSTYESFRLPHANAVMERSRINGKLYDFADHRFAELGLREIGGRDGLGCSAGDMDKLRGLGQTLREGWRWAWETEVEADRKHACDHLEERFRALLPN